MRTASVVALLASILLGVLPCQAQRVLGVRPTGSGGPLMPEQAAYDVTFYDLDLRIDPAARTIEGSLTAHAEIVQPLEWYVFDLDTLLTVSGVEVLAEDGTARLAAFRRDGWKLWVHLLPVRQPGDRVVLRVWYGGAPRVAPRPPWVGGFTWTQTPSGQPWIATSVQGEGADVWWPCKDHPSDEPDSMALHIAVPEPLVVATNGRLRGVDEAAGQRTYHWFVSTPVNNYGVALNIAPYRTIEGSYESTSGEVIPITFWVLPEHYEQGQQLFPQFAEHLRFYEEYLGPYPWRADKYGVAETPHLGMEHQTIIAYGDDFQDNEFGYDGLHHHELGHEWWGNLVTALDWRDYWLHEGFCSYMQPLYAEYLQGAAAYHRAMAGSRGNIRNRQPVAPAETRNSTQVYFLAPDYVESDGDIYNKGKWILHTLRYLIGDEAFFTSLRRMAYPTPAWEQRKDGTQARFATTDDYRLVAEAASGQELGWFFDVYLRQPLLPRLVTEREDNQLRLRWETPDELPFPMPVQVQIGDETRRIAMPAGRAVVALPDAQTPVHIDPEQWILKEEGRTASL